MDDYICKIASIDEMNTKWDYEIDNAKETYPDGTVIDVEYYGKNL